MDRILGQRIIFFILVIYPPPENINKVRRDMVLTLAQDKIGRIWGCLFEQIIDLSPKLSGIIYSLL